MNKDQILGTLKAMAGSAQEQAGRLLGSRQQQAKGLQKQVLGRADRRLGDARLAAK